ncbi:hypothetical protein HBQ51_02590, partial [Staphylococcus aureus]|nr:hypothetical protein [Staphylococcus aureus]
VGNKENPGYYKQTIYVNPSENSLTNAKLKVQAYHSSYPNNIGQINKDVTDIKIYHVPKGYTLNKGYDVNTKELTDVTNQYLQKITYGDNNSAVNLDFGDIQHML